MREIVNGMDGSFTLFYLFYGMKINIATYNVLGW